MCVLSLIFLHIHSFLIQQVCERVSVGSVSAFVPAQVSVTSPQTAASCAQMETNPLSITASSPFHFHLVIISCVCAGVCVALTVILLALLRAATQSLMSVTSLAWRKYLRETALMTAEIDISSMNIHNNRFIL